MMEMDNRPLRLCVLNPGPAVPGLLMENVAARAGGAEVQIVALARALRARGWEVTFALAHPREAPELETPEGIRLVHVKPGRLPELRFWTRALGSSWRAVCQNEADVYLQKCVNWQSGICAWACRRRGRPYILWLAFLGDVYAGAHPDLWRAPRERGLLRYGLQHATTVVAQTERQRRRLREQLGRDAVVIPNLWPTPEPHYAPPADPPEVLWAARIAEIKRPHLALDVAEALPELRFIMAGAPVHRREALYAEVRERAESLSNVEWLGFVPFGGIDRYYARAAAILNTSTMEGFPNTFLQAWSHGRPVVATFDPDEVLCRRQLGWHCQDREELVAALPRAVEQGAEYAERVRAYVRENHSPEVVLPQVERMLRESIARGCRGQAAVGPAPVRG